jgi:hypothetical protein
MCGGRDDATKAAQETERKRQIQVANATNAVERAFGGPERQGQLDDFIKALRGEFTTEAGRQKKIIDRRAKFSLARSGLTGGSAAADVKTDIGRQFQTGLIESERLSQSSLADLIAADQASKRQLTALAQGGGSVASAAASSAAALKSNIAGARSGTAVSSLGDIFSEQAAVSKAAEEASQRRRGLRESQVFADPFSRGT